MGSYPAQTNEWMERGQDSGSPIVARRAAGASLTHIVDRVHASYGAARIGRLTVRSGAAVLWEGFVHNAIEVVLNREGLESAEITATLSPGIAPVLEQQTIDNTAADADGGTYTITLPDASGAMVTYGFTAVAGATEATIATQIAARAFASWTTENLGGAVRLTSTIEGDRQLGTFAAGTSGIAATVVETRAYVPPLLGLVNLSGFTEGRQF